jgi:CheY-like chemotaxis protein
MDLRITARIRLLVADDDASLREALGEFFAREGYSVQLASSGLEAIDFLRRRLCDVSVLDGHMPGLTGPQVLRQLLCDAGPAAIPPTLLVSSDASIGAWVHEQFGRQDLGGSAGFAPGAANPPDAGGPRGALGAAALVGFVPKPFRLAALRHSLEQLLERHPPLPPL